MSITANELKTYKSITVDDTSSNGGIMSAVEVISNAGENVFPHVFKNERVSGSTKYRKLFDKIGNADSDIFYNSSYFFDGPTLGDDWAIFFEGTQRDTEADMVETSYYGSGLLNQDVIAGDSEISFDVKDVSLIGMISIGSIIRISDKPTFDGVGNVEFHTVDNSGVSVVGTVVTFNIEEILSNSYLTADDTKISTVYNYGDIELVTDNWDDSNTSSGTYDESGSPITLNNLGTVEDTWTLTFTSATEFNVVGLYRGSVGSGQIGVNFSPLNSAFSQPLFNILSAGWGGTWAINDTIVFQTHPAAVPLWEKRVIPAGCTPLSSNKIVKITSGEVV